MLVPCPLNNHGLWHNLKKGCKETCMKPCLQALLSQGLLSNVADKHTSHRTMPVDSPPQLTSSPMQPRPTCNQQTDDCCNTQSWQPPWNFALSNKSSVTATASLRATSVLCNRRRDMMYIRLKCTVVTLPPTPSQLLSASRTLRLSLAASPYIPAHTRLLTHAASGSHTTVGCHSHSLPADASRSTLRRCNASQQQLILSTLVCRPHRRSKP
ncbi:hypothetical protein COO60DRAFT_823668 [Scenedesmus sp. NREL 46B-D3]|nr:hypothetical protein COO60DRAFT_823668 [Scenedesmus sp. NREL 46B-D3]